MHTGRPLIDLIKAFNSFENHNLGLIGTERNALCTCALRHIYFKEHFRHTHMSLDPSHKHVHGTSVEMLSASTDIRED